MNIDRIDHVGLACRNLEKAVHFYGTVLGLPIAGEETLEEMKLRVCKIRVGETILELLEPMEGEMIVSKFLRERGEGVHHICFAVEDIRAAMETLVSRGCQPVWDEPRVGAGGKWVNFLRPRDTHGVLLELNQERKTTTDP